MRFGPFYLFFLLLIFISSFAFANSQKATLWNTPLEYELIFVNKKNVDYDGKSFVVSKGKKEINRVIINTAFFEKEAKELWESLQNKKSISYDLSPDLMSFLDRLNKNHPNQSLIADLLELKEQLQQAAWLDTYQKVIRENKNETQAKKDFIKIFCQTRIQAITWHELSHLLDEKQKNTSQSEVKAFLTELVYGKNPQDVLWQLISGVVSEIEKGNAMDDSVQKLKDVLMAARNMPWLTQGEQVCFLCFLSKGQVKEIALWAYQKKTEPSFEEGPVSL